MTTLPVNAIPPAEPFDAPRGVIRGSLDRLPGADANLPPLEKLSPSELDSISTEANAFSGRLLDRIAAWEAEIEDERQRAEARYAKRDMPAALRRQRAKEDSEDFRRQVVANSAAERAELLQAVRQREARVMAQREHYRSVVHLLQSHSFSSESIKLMPALAGAGVAGLLTAYRDAYSTKSVWLGAALLSRVGSLADEDRNRMAASGYDSKALAERLLGEQFAVARESFKRIELARDAAEASNRAFESGKPDPHAAIRRGLKEGDYEGHRRDPH